MFMPQRFQQDGQQQRPGFQRLSHLFQGMQQGGFFQRPQAQARLADLMQRWQGMGGGYGQ